MTKILVLLGNSYIPAIDGLGIIKTHPSDFFTNPNEYGLVLFTGGEDITPSWYGETSPKRMCYNSEERDDYEKTIFDHAVKHGIRMTGICRGVQFLNVMAGGKMYHNVDNHSGGRHAMELANGDVFGVNSLHHQMVIPPKDALVAGWAPQPLSNSYYGDGDRKIDAPNVEPESIIYPSIQSAGVQYHPEMMSTGTEGWKYFQAMAKALIETPDFADVTTKFMEGKWDSGQLTQLAR